MYRKKMILALMSTLMGSIISFGCGSGDESLQNHTIADIVNTFKEHQFEIGEVSEKAAGMLGAQDGYSVELDGDSIEIYKYNMSDEGAKNILADAEKDGYISVFGKFTCKVRPPFLLIRHNVHPYGEKIVEVFMKSEIVSEGASLDF